VLWDCVSLLDDATIQAVRALGGITAIAISHPHFYSSMIEWSQAFDAPVYLHADNLQWVMRPDPAIVY
jgi:glyoxylase-like metal-dependent hydrolase (beta-lactamase superfamily II)